MTLRVGINGFGRIGRSVFRALVTEAGGDVRVVAVNDVAVSGLLAHLLKFDTKCGPWSSAIGSEPDSLYVEGLRVSMLSEHRSGADKLGYVQRGCGCGSDGCVCHTSQSNNSLRC